jgi:raffinose/stachyose/melibiose transport system substrate-binding protein
VSNKKVLTRSGIVAAAALALLLAGCSTNAPAGSPSESSGSKGGTSGNLSIFWKASEAGGIDAVVADFKKAYPRINVTLTTAQTDQYQPTVRTQLSAGNAADVIFAWPGNGNAAAIRQLQPGGYLKDLSSMSFADKYPAALKKLMQINGKTYLMAPAVSSFGPWYNQETLDSTSLKAPQKWSDVLPFCAAAAAKGKVAWAIGAQVPTNNQNVLYSLVPNNVYGADPNFDTQLASGKTSFSDNAGWKSALSKLQQMIKAGCFTKDATGVSQDQQNAAVANGQALGMFSIGYQVAALKQLNPSGDFRLYPLNGSNTGKTIMTVSSAGGGAINAKAKDPANAVTFINFLATNKEMTRYDSALAATVPSIPDGSKSDDSTRTTISKYLADGQTVHFLNQLWPDARTEQAMYSGVQGLFTGTQQPSDVLAAMTAAFTG